MPRQSAPVSTSVKPLVVGVVGAGTMGRGIAQIAALVGHKAILVDTHPARSLDAVQVCVGEWEKLAAKGKLTESEVIEAKSRLIAGKAMAALGSADAVIEAVFEDLEIKRQVFRDIEAQVSDRAIVATNTSALSVTAIAASCKHPERVVGMHFFNPVHRMTLVEVVAGHRTSPEVVVAALDLAFGLGKSPIRVQDTPGFVVNRVARPFYLEALEILGERLFSAGQIDATVRAAGFRMGPFELMDLIGIDINFAVTNAVYDGFFGEPRFRPHLIQRQMVQARQLGRKTGSGFYEYGPAGSIVPSPVLPPDSGEWPALPGLHPIATRIVAMLVNEAAFTLGDGIAKAADIDLAMKLGTNYPEGPLEWADRLGANRIVTVLDGLFDFYRRERYRVAPALRRAVLAGRKVGADE